MRGAAVTLEKARAVGFVVEALDRLRFLRRNHADTIGAYRDWLDGLEALAELLARPVGQAARARSLQELEGQVGAGDVSVEEALHVSYQRGFYAREIGDV